MDIFRVSARAMAMDEATWARHANPWSFWTRFASLPLLALAVWSRVWLGWWALAAVAAALAWIWFNPRIFPRPRSLDNWASRGVIGERIFLARRAEVAAHHRRAAAILSGISAAGALVMAAGLWAFDLTATLAGMIASMMAKAWFVDRMSIIALEWRAAGRPAPVEAV